MFGETRLDSFKCRMKNSLSIFFIGSQQSLWGLDLRDLLKQRVNLCDF